MNTWEKFLDMFGLYKKNHNVKKGKIMLGISDLVLVHSDEESLC